MTLQASNRKRRHISPTTGAALLIVLPLLALATGAGAETQSITYTYDRSGRLTGAVYDNQVVQSYDHDALGNVLRREIAVAPTPIPSDGGAVTLSGLISDTETSEFRFTLAGAGTVRIGYHLGSPLRGGCRLLLTAVHPDGTSHRAVEMLVDSQLLTLPGQDGVWTLQVSAEGGCAAQHFTLELEPSAQQLLSSPPGGLMLLGLLLAGAVLVACRNRRNLCPS